MAARTTLDRVSPTKKYLERLYLHFFDIDYPSVCHIGLPLSIVPFPLFQYQAKLAARVYAEKVQLPTLGQMVQERAAEEQIALDWAASEAQNTEVEVQDEDLVDPLNRVHHFNPPGKPHKQFDYCDAIADMCNGGPAVGVSASATDETRDKHKDACTDAAHNTPLHLHPHKGTGTGQGSALVGEDNAPTAASASPNGTNGTVSGAAPVEHTPPYFKDLFASAKEERFALLGF
ncbi:hypothetical protein SARC_10367 [Sphaeroforma arctica JP610]|uniref:Uncharacterized protein n=1 Tax=Sphaeroforma arctica JP610 TaxID=667725 RepID=A0A0L0FMA4_9EUKA|nr:hypothetical protein SARC_10367 [Sphaeroforma arctica JP610]KNC77163.1 hypothetical protein SARC_10367 [Sphaeroforma arctica JP610]|eukprot:XP_014151065.1 hypothetical protein SARC_10367 [Sphaeroforma arctica JP610]